MLVNSKLTLYHKTINPTTRLEEWTRHNYDNVWFFGGKGAGINKGYVDANDCDVRIPYKQNENLDISNFKKGDIIIPLELKKDIQQQQDLKQYDVYNITSITNNTYGVNPHIHLGGK